jgi:cysteine-rich repeat protein
MRSISLNAPLFCSAAALGAALFAQVAGCGGSDSTTSQATGSVGSTSSSGGTAGNAATSGTGGTGATTTTTTGSGGMGGATTSSAGGGTTTSTSASTAASSSGTVSALCGNGTLDPGEQCDDGNSYDLDGCDSGCNYEVVTRMSTLSIATTAGPAFCVHKGNALGSKALNALAVSVVLNPALTTAVNGATVNVLTEFVGLSDPTGTSATGFDIGVVDAILDPAKGAWPGNNPTDWWFLADPSVVNMGQPTGKLTNGKLVNHALTAGPNTVSLTISLSGTPADLTLNNASIAGTVGNATNTPAPPPAKIEAGLMVLETITANGTNQGLCGDITVGSLKAIAVPAALIQGGSNACTENYTAANSLLDVLVVGCKVTSPLSLTAVNATQPDVPGSGTTVTHLTAGAGNIVTVPANDTDAYSSYFQFVTTREHISGQSCTTAAQCQTSPASPSAPQVCTASVCTPE